MAQCVWVAVTATHHTITRRPTQGPDATGALRPLLLLDLSAQALLLRPQFGCELRAEVRCLESRQ
jgi:hypothetical protein